MTFKVPEQFRVRRGPIGTDESHGNNGAFYVTLRHNQKVKVVASDGLGWEHVSVSREDRVPTWDEMEQVKQLFWGPDATVMQLHVPRGEWISNHDRCLHLWRPIDVHIPRPPSITVGVQGVKPREIERNPERYLPV